VLKKISSLTIKCLLSGLLSSCAVAPPDVPICTELSMTRGFCTYTVSDKDFYIDETHPFSFYDNEPPQTWWDLRPTFVLVPAPSWAKIKAFTIKVCKKYGQCDKTITSWDRKLSKMDEELKKKEDK
jgi:hypothetical protein